MLLKSNYWRFKKGFRNLLQTFDCCGQQWFSPTGLTVGTWTFSLIDWMVWSQQSAQLALKSFLLTTIKQNWMEKKVSKLSFFGPHFRVLMVWRTLAKGTKGGSELFFDIITPPIGKYSPSSPNINTLISLTIMTDKKFEKLWQTDFEIIF